MKAPEPSAVAIVVTETRACIGVVMTGGARAVCGAAGIVGGGSCGVTICGLTICGLTTFGVSARKSRLQPREFLISSAKRLLQQYRPGAEIEIAEERA